MYLIGAIAAVNQKVVFLTILHIIIFLKAADRIEDRWKRRLIYKPKTM